ncbi:hypothetical protein ACNPNP_19670 [Microbacterium sp. AGC85]
MSAAVPPSQAHARSRVANAVKYGLPPEVIADRRRDLAAANIAAAIDRALSTAPALSDEQCARLAARLRGA